MGSRAGFAVSNLKTAPIRLIELKRQLQAGQPGSVIDKTVKKIEAVLCASGASLVYAGYPCDPFAADAPS